MNATSPKTIAKGFTRNLLIGLSLFFYIPVAYYYGWALLPTSGLDFPSYYYAARLAFVYGRTPYGLTAFHLLPVDMGRVVPPYLYPPPSLLAFWPLSGLSLLDARAAFFLVSHFCFIGSIWLILTKLTPLPQSRRLREISLALSLIYLLCFDPALVTLAIGQVNLVALLFICLALAALRNSSSAWKIALPLSVAILLKTYPVLLLLPLLFRKQFRALALTAAFSVGFAAIAVLTLPGDVWQTWFAQIVPIGGYANNVIAAGFAWNQSINGFVMRLLFPSIFSPTLLNLPTLAKPLITALAALVAGVTIFFSFRRSILKAPKGKGDDEIAAFLLMIYLIAPLSWDHHLVYILPAAILAIISIVDGSTHGKAAIALTFALCLIAWKIPLDYPDLMHGWWTLLISTKFYAVVALWLFFINRLRKPAVVAI